MVSSVDTYAEAFCVSGLTFSRPTAGVSAKGGAGSLAQRIKEILLNRAEHSLHLRGIRQVGRRDVYLTGSGNEKIIFRIDANKPSTSPLWTNITDRQNIRLLNEGGAYIIAWLPRDAHAEGLIYLFCVPVTSTGFIETARSEQDMEGNIKLYVKRSAEEYVAFIRHDVPTHRFVLEANWTRVLRLSMSEKRYLSCGLESNAGEDASPDTFTNEMTAHGFEPSPAIRKAIETYAMLFTQSELLRLGFEQIDSTPHLTEPFDISAVRDNVEVHVEVKELAATAAA